jgi:hypothetical protein
MERTTTKLSKPLPIRKPFGHTSKINSQSSWKVGVAVKPGIDAVASGAATSPTLVADTVCQVADALLTLGADAVFRGADALLTLGSLCSRLSMELRKETL